MYFFLRKKNITYMSLYYIREELPVSCILLYYYPKKHMIFIFLNREQFFDRNLEFILKQHSFPCIPVTLQFIYLFCVVYKNVSFVEILRRAKEYKFIHLKKLKAHISTSTKQFH